MIRLSDISLPPEHSAHQLPFEAARMLRIPNSKIRGVRIVRRSVDARKKPNVRIIYTIDVTVDGSEKKILKQSGCKRASIAPATRYMPPKSAKAPEKRPVVVGFGPGGMFAALILALAGWKPLVLERGEDAESRHEKVEKFFQTGELDTKSNVQFGEGGAGTFSDGKLNTGVNNPRIGWILEQFVAAGAREDILYDAKPHVGTDVLLTVVQNLRKRIISLGGEVRFNTQVTGLCTENGRLTGLKIADGTVIPCDRAVLAIGHSARDTFEMLDASGVPMEPKPFAMGVRIEQKQRDIDIAQYGGENPALPPADYKLVEHLDGETVYTFCMCPGGFVVAAARRIQAQQTAPVDHGRAENRGRADILRRPGESKMVELSVVKKKQQNCILISMVNSCDMAPIKDANGNFETGKDKSKGHGYGTKSIARVIQKYNGEADMRYDEETKEFHSIIRFPVHS